MTQRRSSEEVKSLIEAYRQRGRMTRRGFCEGQGISLPTLDYYLRRYSESAVRLAKIEVSAEAVEMTGGFTLVLGNGRRIECGQAGLAELIRVAEVS
ncbi:MAG: hypothetical protein H7Y20_02625 [Bryobacteraceae bacterium]|nr:hypothetical protein [Bryobacteraceae bacterium]